VSFGPPFIQPATSNPIRTVCTQVRVARGRPVIAHLNSWCPIWSRDGIRPYTPRSELVGIESVGFSRAACPHGRGEGVSIIDIEDGWRFEHEDLPGLDGVSFSHGINHGGEHGTAVAGELWGVENSIGVTGIAPLSGVGWSSVSGAGFPNNVLSPAEAITNAAEDLSAGGVILIEQHMPLILDPTGRDFPAGCNDGKDQGYLPVEVFGAEFDSISYATARGIVVVEAAGNGASALGRVP